MAIDRPVIVYGAAGYTGRLVCEYLREFNVPFVASGADEGQLRDVVRCIPGIEAADYEIVAAGLGSATLRDLFSRARVVINTVGPFSRYGTDVVQASLDAGCHYIDPSGEQDWLLTVQRSWGAEFAAKRLLAAPGVAHMYTTGEIAANICLETPGLDTLDFLVMWKGLPSAASTQTIFSMLKSNWLYLDQNKYVRGAPFTTFDVSVPGRHETAIALPWGGTSHPVWFKNDPRVANVTAAGGIFNRAVMKKMIETAESLDRDIADLPESEQVKLLEQVAGSVQSSTPPRENPRINSTLDSVHASGRGGRAHCVIHGNCNYKQTALLQAYSAYSLLQEEPRRFGFASACQAFGYRELFGVLNSFGLVLNPILSVHF